MSLDSLVDKARKILSQNWNGNFTIPSPSLYPHLWSWDSAFVAIGNSYYDIKRSMKELEFLFDAQWKNGMVPHIVFNEKATTYFPSPEFYDVQRSPDAPKHVKTSGMTQPPVHAIASYYVHANANDKDEVKAFLKRIFPKLIAFHDYLLTVRDPENSGAITIMHPWESGMDNSPIWDDALERLVITDLPDYERKDLANVSDPSERPDNVTYDKFIFLLHLMRKNNYDHKSMYKNYPFKIKGIGFTSILYAANKYLLKIAEIISADTKQIEDWQDRIKSNFSKNFCQSPGKDPLCYNYDMMVKKFVIKQAVASMLPLYAGLLSGKQAGAFVKLLGNARFCGTSCHVESVPSIALDEDKFSPKTYWRGPVWVNPNWMIYYGLLKYGYREKAEQIKKGIIELVSEHGFREYFNPHTGEGYGAKDFSWTAALLIDMIEDRGTGIPPD